MEVLMLVAEGAVEIRVLSRQGKSIRDIARMLKVSRNTMRLKGEETRPRYFCAPQKLNDHCADQRRRSSPNSPLGASVRPEFQADRAR
jgi:transposase